MAASGFGTSFSGISEAQATEIALPVGLPPTTLETKGSAVIAHV